MPCAYAYAYVVRTCRNMDQVVLHMQTTHAFILRRLAFCYMVYLPGMEKR